MKLKLIFISGLTGFLIGLTIGYVYFTFLAPAEFPDIEVIAVLDKTKFQIGEKVYVKPYIVNRGNRPIRIIAHGKLLFREVYDENNRRVSIPDSVRADVQFPHTLKPHRLYNELSNPLYRFSALLETFAFTLDKPGRYELRVWAEIGFTNNPSTPLHVYRAKSIWIEVVP